MYHHQRCLADSKKQWSWRLKGVKKHHYAICTLYVITEVAQPPVSQEGGVQSETLSADREFKLMCGKGCSVNVCNTKAIMTTVS